jgi:hypothetical protein
MDYNVNHQLGCWAFLQAVSFGLCMVESKGVFEDNGITIQQIKNIKFKGLSQLTQKKDRALINCMLTRKLI